MRRSAKILWLPLGLAVVATLVFHQRVEIALGLVRQRFIKKTIQDRLAEFGQPARQRLAIYFTQQTISYPPQRIVITFFKDKRELQIYAGDSRRMAFIRRYPVLAASGVIGPKLREGDQQVPEGVYGIESVNPNSAYHVSLRLDYPNAFDRDHARKDGRTKLGGDIMIHGKAASIGCIAVGDPAAEELFTLAAESGLTNITVILSPVDFRTGAQFATAASLPSWSDELYGAIRAQLDALPRAESQR